MKKRITALLVSALLLLSVGLPMAACAPTVPEWDTQAELTEDGVRLTLTKVEGAEVYRIYHSPSRYGEYELVSEQTRTKYEHEDKYGYFLVESVSKWKIDNNELITYDTETFGENVYIYAPTDDAAAINADISEKFETLEDGQFSSERFGVFFKAGEYPDVRIIAGLYYNPNQVIARADSNVKTLSDFKGKVFAPGVAGGTTIGETQVPCKAAGLNYPGDIKPQYVGPAEAGDLMRNKQIDGTWIMAGLPNAGVSEMCATAIDSCLQFLLIPCIVYLSVVSKNRVITFSICKHTGGHTAFTTAYPCCRSYFFFGLI